MSRGFREKERAECITAKQTAYCPHCRAVTNLNVSITLRSIIGPDGDEEIVASRVYHCEACLFFVGSDEDIAETLMNHGVAIVNNELKAYNNRRSEVQCAQDKRNDRGRNRTARRAEDA